MSIKRLRLPTPTEIKLQKKFIFFLDSGDLKTGKGDEISILKFFDECSISIIYSSRVIGVKIDIKLVTYISHCE